MEELRVQVDLPFRSGSDRRMANFMLSALIDASVCLFVGRSVASLAARPAGRPAVSLEEEFLAPHSDRRPSREHLLSGFRPENIRMTQCVNLSHLLLPPSYLYVFSSFFQRNQPATQIARYEDEDGHWMTLRLACSLNIPDYDERNATRASKKRSTIFPLA